MHIKTSFTGVMLILNKTSFSGKFSEKKVFFFYVLSAANRLSGQFLILSIDIELLHTSGSVSPTESKDMCFITLC